MGHSVNYHFLNATTKERAMKEGLLAAEEWAEMNGDRMEGSTSYHDNFRFYNKTFNTEDEAIEFFNGLGSYNDGVCLVKEATRGATNKYNKIATRIREKKQELREKALEKFKERTSASVGCRKCGTRVSSEEAIKRNLICPSCRNWLVPDSYKAKLQKLDETLEKAQVQLNTTTAESGKPRYWCKYEVHC